MSQQKQTLKGKRILIFQQRGWALTVGHFLAKKLQEEGATLAALTMKRTTHKFITSQKEVAYEMIVASDDATSNPKKFLDGDSFTLQEICNAMGVNSIWPFVQSERNHVRSYKDKYYYGFKQNVSDEGIVDYVMAIYKYAKKIFDEFKPDMIIAPNFVASQHIMFNLIAKKRAIPMIALVDSKISENHIIVESYNYDRGDFFERIDILNSNMAISPNAEKARKYIYEFRKSFKNPENAEYYSPGSKKKKLWQKIRHFLSPYYHIFKWYTNHPINYWEVIGPSIDYRPPSIILRDHFAYDRQLKFAQNYSYYTFDKLGKFAYFPLQTQPEESIDVLAPFFNNQIEVARQVAMSLPDDYTLVVKEHPAMVGLRSASYLEKIDRTPNVKLIDYRISSETVLLKADIIICPVGTTIAEAAFLNKPVIQLGNLGTTLKLPNVWKHTDMTTLSAKIKEVLATNLNTKEYERGLQNYVSAVYDTSVELKYADMWERNKETEKKDILWQALRNKILNSIN